MAKQKRLLAALTLTFGVLPTHLAIATSVAPIPEVTDFSENTENLEEGAPSLPPLFIKAISPGYTIDKVSNTGEFIELTNSTANLVSLEGISLWYNNGTKDYLVYEFPEYSFLAPGSLVLRLKSSPEIKAVTDLLTISNVTYAKDIAMSGALRLVAKNTASDEPTEPAELILDSVCWTGKPNCLPAFTSANPRIIVRDDETLEFAQLESYTPNFNPEALQIIIPEPVTTDPGTTETNSTNADEASDSDASSSNGTSIASSTSVNSSIDTGLTLSTLAPCPEGKYRNPETNRCKNIETEPEEKTCAEGYYLNPSTNRCKKIEVVAEEKTCKDGYYLNPATNRCKKLPTEKELTPCKEGYERNPETNRCRKIADDTEDELSPCAEGYERNPETSRCRKIKTNDGADYALVPTAGGIEQKDFTALWALGGVALVGVGVVIFQFHHELAHFFKSLRSKFLRKH